MRIREILKRGSWLYDGGVRATVAIARQNYFEGPEVTDEPKLPGYPPTDADGCFYAVEYEIPGTSKGVGGRVFGNAEGAIRHAEATLKGLIRWNSGADALIFALDHFLEGHAGVTETCREVVRHHNSHSKEQFELFKLFIAVSSETDEFPIGPPRQFWSDSALEREDKERAATEARYVQKLRAAALPLRQYACEHGDRIR